MRKRGEVDGESTKKGRKRKREQRQEKRMVRGV